MQTDIANTVGSMKDLEGPLLLLVGVEDCIL